MTIAILIVITATLVAILRMMSPSRNARRIQRGADRAERMNRQRDIISIEAYRRQLREAAKQNRCPECNRAAGRPCIPGCRGRRDVSTDWTG